MSIVTHQGTLAALRMIVLTAWITVIDQQQQGTLDTVRHTLQPGLQCHVDLGNIADRQFHAQRLQFLHHLLAPAPDVLAQFGGERVQHRHRHVHGVGGRGQLGQDGRHERVGDIDHQQAGRGEPLGLGQLDSLDQFHHQHRRDVGQGQPFDQGHADDLVRGQISNLCHLHDDQDAPDGLYKTLSDLIKGRKTAEQRKSPRQPRNHPFGLLYGLRQVHSRLGELTSGLPVGEPGEGQIACLQVNQSKTGAAFRLQGPLDPPLGIGETILAEASNPSPGGAPIGFIGRIQRLVADGRGIIEIGVEKLVGGLMPVTLSGGAAERARGDTYALLQHSPESNHLLLLAIRNIYREGDTVIAEGVNSRYTLRMHTLQQTTRRVAYIEVEVVD